MNNLAINISVQCDMTMMPEAAQLMSAQIISACDYQFRDSVRVNVNNPEGIYFRFLPGSFAAVDEYPFFQIFSVSSQYSGLIGDCHLTGCLYAAPIRR